MNIHTDWFKAFKTAMKEPPRLIAMHLIEDLFASMGREKATQLLQDKVGAERMQVLELSRAGDSLGTRLADCSCWDFEGADGSCP